VGAHLLLEWPEGRDSRPLETLAELVRCGEGELHLFAAAPQEAPQGVRVHPLAALGEIRSLLSERSLVPDDCTLAGFTAAAYDAARAARVRFARLSDGAAWPQDRPLEHDFAGIPQLEAWFSQMLHLERGRWPIATVGGLVFREDGRALFVRTPKWSGRWGTPGGKIEYGEGHLDAFVREIAEETGLVATEPRVVLVQEALEDPDFVKKRHFLLVNLVARTATAEVRLNHESVESGWFSLRESLALDLNRPTRLLVEHLLRTGDTL